MGGAHGGRARPPICTAARFSTKARLCCGAFHTGETRLTSCVQAAAVPSSADGGRDRIPPNRSRLQPLPGDGGWRRCRCTVEDCRGRVQAVSAVRPPRSRPSLRLRKIPPVVHSASMSRSCTGRSPLTIGAKRTERQGILVRCGSLVITRSITLVPLRRPPGVGSASRS